MAKMKTYTLDELKDKAIGKIGTPERDKYEADLKEELQAYHIGENRSAESTNLPIGKRQECYYHLNDASIQSHEHYRHIGSKRSGQSGIVLIWNLYKQGEGVK